MLPTCNGYFLVQNGVATLFFSVNINVDMFIWQAPCKLNSGNVYICICIQNFGPISF